MKRVWGWVFISSLIVSLFCGCGQPTKRIEDLIQSQLEDNLDGFQWELPLPNADQRMRFVYVKAGTLKMGLSKDELERLIRETRNPVYEIEEVSSDHTWQPIPHAFLIGKYEVTHEAYKALIPEHQYPPESARKPVTNLTEGEIRKFCQRLNAAYPQLEIGLPTEKEWEYAAKGTGGNTPYTWGDKFDKKNANVSSKKLLEVGKKTASDSWCGASDLIGNAAEVCEVDTETYPHHLEQRLVARGGSYRSDAFDSRTTSRHPLWTPKSDDIGFRIVIRFRK